MSKNASMDLSLDTKGKSYHKSLIAIISENWTANLDGKMMLLPLGDEGDYDWKIYEYDEDYMHKLVLSKMKAGEIIGITLRCADFSEGGEFLFFPDSAISINLSIELRMIEVGSQIVEFSWYLKRIIPNLLNADIEVISYVCSFSN